MSLSKAVRQGHRWLSIIFTAMVAAIFIAKGTGAEPAEWIYLVPLAPLALLAATGLYMFVLPYAARRAGRSVSIGVRRMAGKVPAEPRLLSGGNPQIPKGYGEAPVQAYIAAMPGWKSEVGRRLDAIVTQAVPGVRKAVKWNSPFYGVEDDVWFLSFHCFTRYIKVTFFRGASLRPVPPGRSKYEEVRYLDIHEGQLDEAQFADWARQASRLPGERM